MLEHCRPFVSRFYNFVLVPFLKMTVTYASRQTSSPNLLKRLFNRPEFQLLICALGIYTCYLRYGLLQERIYKTQYAPNVGFFKYSSFLIAVQTATNAAVAFVGTRVTLNSVPSGKIKSNKKVGKPYIEYAVVALSYLLAMWCSFTALGYMSYPMQALGKSCKMIPVMLMGIVIRRRRYSVREFFCVGLITAGVALFSWKSNSSKVQSSPIGFALLFLSLFMDGVTGPLQERLVARHSPTTHELMFGQNLCAFIWLIAGLLITGEGSEAMQFIRKAPGVVSDILTFSMVSAIGQNFIFYTVRNFSALAVTTITTTRKMFTVLLSIFVYGHMIVPRQWLGLFLVFAAITWEAIAKHQAKGAKAAAAAKDSKKEKSSKDATRKTRSKSE